MDPFETLDLASAEMERRVGAVPADRWDAPTPCEGWSARHLVHHVVGGNRMAVRLLAGGRRKAVLAELRAAPVADDQLAAFTATAAEQAAAFRAPGALERTCEHPAGDISGARLLGFRVGDLTLHAWDLARAVGGDERLHPDLVAAVHEVMAPMAPFIARTGFFGTGPSGTLPDTASLQDRLLDLTGRRP